MKLSVCIATYNGEKYIKEQIASILPQIGEKDELIISDDLSNDETLNIIKSFGDKRIKIYTHETDHGFVRNFENALKKATGDVIFLSDQDDIWMPNKVEECLKILRRVDFVVSDCITVDDNMNILSQSRIKDYNIRTGFWRLMIKTRYLGCCMAFRRKVLDAALPFPQNAYLIEHDLWLAAVAEKYFATAIIDKPLIYYRRHDGNVSSGGQGKGYSLPVKIYRRLYRLVKIIGIKKRVRIVKNK